MHHHHTHAYQSQEKTKQKNKKTKREMCRCAEFEGTHLRESEREMTIRIRAFYLRIGITESARLPETMTLVYLPGITNGVMEINGASKLRSGSPALLSLHRMRTAERDGGSEAVFASTDRVKVGDGTRFEVYVGEVRAVVGVLRKRRGKGDVEKWEMECECDDEQAEMAAGVLGFDVRVVDEGGEVLSKKVQVQMTKAGRRRRRVRVGKALCSRLQGIPEEEDENGRVGDGWSSSSNSLCSSCSCCCQEKEWELVSSLEVTIAAEAEAEAMRWAIDVGIWVVSLGVGILVAKASTAKRRRKFLF